MFKALTTGNEDDRKIRLAQVVAMLNGQQVEADKTAALKKAGNLILAGVGLYVFYRWYKKGKRK